MYNSLIFHCYSLVYAKSQEIYMQNRDEFFKKLREKRPNKTEKSEFEIYFNKNWEPITRKWVRYMRADCMHLGNNTNNRLESAWGTLKLELKHTTPLDKAIGKTY